VATVVSHLLKNISVISGVNLENELEYLVKNIEKEK